MYLENNYNEVAKIFKTLEKYIPVKNKILSTTFHIKKADYFENPDEFFGSIILHLRQSGYDIPLNYSLISEYLSSDVPNKSYIDIDISNNEKKILKREVEGFANDFGYDLS